MRVRGIVYDTGVAQLAGRHSRPAFDPDEVRHDLAVIATELHANAVRLTGQDPARLRVAARCAAEAGLAVWLSPALPDATPDQALGQLAEVAADAERLRADGAEVVLVAGWELTFFMRGIVAGATAVERLTTLSSPPRLLWSVVRRGPFPRNLNRHLRRAAATARRHFGGPVTYAAADVESVDWSPFDIVAVDHYRSAANRSTWDATIAGLRRHGKPVVLTEVGCAAYRGAADRGALAWTVVDRATDPPRLTGAPDLDEAGQAAEVGELLDVAGAAGAEGAFVFTYAAFSYPAHDDPAHDLDRAGYGLVGVRPGQPRRRKPVFDAVARRYAAG